MPKRIKTVKQMNKFERKLQARSQPQVKGILNKKIVVRQAISRRGREQPFQAPRPSQPQTTQTLFLDSTAIAHFEYNIRSQVLRIWFVSSGIYDYFRVPQVIVERLANAPSKGHYFYYNIRTQYEFKRIQ